MKTSIEVIQNEIGRPENVLKRTSATKLDIAMLADHIQGLHVDTCGALESKQQQIRLLDEKLMEVDAVIHSIDHSMAQCQNVIQSVKETLDGQTRDLTAEFTAAERNLADRAVALDARVDLAGESIRLLDARDAQQYETMRSRVQLLEERIPQLETDVETLGKNIGRMEQIQLKINARIVTVMRMSLMIIGVLIVTTVALGLIYFKH